jgi:hypothetical protein
MEQSLQEPANGHYPEPDESRAHPQSLFMWHILSSPSQPRLRLPSVLFPSSLPTKICSEPLIHIVLVSLRIVISKNYLELLITHALLKFIISPALCAYCHSIQHGTHYTIITSLDTRGTIKLKTYVTSDSVSVALSTCISGERSEKNTPLVQHAYTLELNCKQK